MGSKQESWLVAERNSTGSGKLGRLETQKMHPDWISVNRAVSCIILIASLGCFGSAFLGGQDRATHGPPPLILKIDGVGGADVSPTEEAVAATACEPLKDSGTPRRHLNFVETWDIRDSKLLLRGPLTDDQVPTASCEAGDVRYSGDGKLLVVLTGQGQLVRVFSADTLKELRTIQIPLRIGEIHFGNYSISANWQAKVTGFEVSPVGHLLALRIYRGDYDKHTFFNAVQFLGGFIRVYDLDSGVQINEWEIPTGYLAGNGDGGLAWRQDGKVLAAAAPDRIPCEPGGGTVYFFDVPASRPLGKIRTPNLVGDVAFGTGDTFYAVNASCPGYFGNKEPRLPIFDAASGKGMGDIEFAGSGIRYNLAVSANRQVLLGYVGKEEMRWEFEDTLEVIDQRFAVWDLARHRVLYVSPDLGSHGPDETVEFTFRLSASGRWALLRPKIQQNQLWLFSLPSPVH